MQRFRFVGWGLLLGAGYAAYQEVERLKLLAKHCTFTLGEWLESKK